MNVLYLHGFRSSPQSMKARRMAAHFETSEHRFVCPQLPASPAHAIELACELIEDRGDPMNDWALIGSSLGGFYATYLAEKFGCRAALLNPAIFPDEDLAGYVGELTMYHSTDAFEWKAEYLHALEALRTKAITRADRYFLLAATGDEVLDWRLMRDFYKGASQHIIEGSDHAISEFERYVARVGAFVVQT